MWGSGGIAPLFMTSALDGGEWSVSRPCRFYRRGKSPRYPLDTMLGGPQSQSGRCGEEQNLALPGIEPGPSSPSLYRLLTPSSPTESDLYFAMPCVRLGNRVYFSVSAQVGKSPLGCSFGIFATPTPRRVIPGGRLLHVVLTNGCTGTDKITLLHTNVTSHDT
jgi:hypothetical protein